MNESGHRDLIYLVSGDLKEKYELAIDIRNCFPDGGLKNPNCFVNMNSELTVTNQLVEVDLECNRFL